MKLLLCSIFITASFCALAQGNNPVSETLVTGSSQMSFGEDPQSQAQKAYLTKMTGEDVFIGLYRIARFKQQPKCGRILAVPILSKSRKAIAQMAMQMNICEDGNPPLQTCDNKHLVLSTFKCPGDIEPHPTAEVQLVIDKAIAEGGLSIAQMTEYMKEKTGVAK